MVPLILLCLSLAAAAPFILGLVPPFGTAVMLRIKNGGLQVETGSLRSMAKQHVEEILLESRVTRGFIAITSANRVVFSRRIPSTTHQRLRNILLNQWA